MSGDTVSSNLVHGENRPIGSVFAPTPNNDPYPLGNHAENNQNLRLGAAVRLVGAGRVDDHAEQHHRQRLRRPQHDARRRRRRTRQRPCGEEQLVGSPHRNGGAADPGPGGLAERRRPPRRPTTRPFPENPVNGAAVANASCPAGVSDSDAVTFCPYRSSVQSDTVGGEFPIRDAPFRRGSARTARTASQFDPNIPTYDAFFGTTLGSGTTGNGLSGATPSAKKTAQLTAYMQAIVDAINGNPATTGTARRGQDVPVGTSVLGVPFYVAVVGTPDNIANLDAGRNDAAFWRGVIDGTTSQADALSQVGVRPGFGWITGTPHGNEPAGGEASVKELYELAARTDCDNARRLANLDVFIQPVTAPDDRDHNVRTTAWSFDPNRDRGTVQMPENQALLDVAVDSTRASSSSTRTSSRRATSSRRTRTRRTTRSRTSRST